jgi:hypothetical protein
MVTKRENKPLPPKRERPKNVTIVLSIALRDRCKIEARQERRSLSNFIAGVLEERFGGLQ